MGRTRQQTRSSVATPATRPTAPSVIDLTSDAEQEKDPGQEKFFTPATKSVIDYASDASDDGAKDIFYTPAQRTLRDLPLRKRSKTESPQKHTHTRIVVEIPVAEVSTHVDHTAPESTEDGDVHDLDAGEDGGNKTEDAEPDRTREIVKESRRKAAQAGATPKKSRIVFDDEPPVPSFTTQDEILLESEVKDSDHDTSEDDAPEEVVTKDAHTIARRQQEQVATATSKAEAALRWKRQTKDATLKKQAQTASKKRKRDSKPSVPLTSSPQPDVEAPHPATESSTAGAANGSDVDIPDAEPIQPASRGNKIDLRNLPETLPDEYLSDSDNDPHAHRSDAGAPARKRQKAKATPALLRRLAEPDRVRDRKIGNTTYRTIKGNNRSGKLLAPKAIHNARCVKEAWLAGLGRSGATRNAIDGAQRQPFRKGFVVKRR